MTAMAFTYILVTRGAGMFMPSLTHLGKLADQIPQIRRRLIYALGASIVVGVLVAAIVTLYLGYTHGHTTSTYGCWAGAAVSVLSSIRWSRCSRHSPQTGIASPFFYSGRWSRPRWWLCAIAFPGGPFHPLDFPWPLPGPCAESGSLSFWPGSSRPSS